MLGRVTPKIIRTTNITSTSDFVLVEDLFTYTHVIVRGYKTEQINMKMNKSIFNAFHVRMLSHTRGDGEQRLDEHFNLL